MKFMDFCAGIGGGRLGLEKTGLECVAFSEIDKTTEETYKLFFNNNELNYGDIMEISPSSLPHFDIMVAGFPCQSFSIIGKRKGLDDLRGQVIYGLINILNELNIGYFILENVKGLLNHNKGRTLESIIEELNNIGYNIEYKILDSQFYGVPQMRERIYIVGIKQNLANNKTWFTFPHEQETPNIKDFLIDEDNNTLELEDSTFQKYLNNKYNKGKFNLNKILETEYLILDTRQSDLRLYEGKVPTLRTGRHGILYVKNGKLKKLSGYESLLLQGFPKDIAIKYKGIIPETKILSQAGNAMTVTTINAIAKRLLKYIDGEW